MRAVQIEGLFRAPLFVGALFGRRFFFLEARFELGILSFPLALLALVGLDVVLEDFLERIAFRSLHPLQKDFMADCFFLPADRALHFVGKLKALLGFGSDFDGLDFFILLHGIYPSLVFFSLKSLLRNSLS